MTDQLYTFSEDELKKMKKADLVALAKYFHIEHDENISKKDLIEKLSQPQQNVTVDGFSIPKYSARVKRIMEANGS